MLFMGSPDLHIDALDDLGLETLDSNGNVCACSTFLLRSHHTVNMSVASWFSVSVVYEHEV